MSRGMKCRGALRSLKDMDIKAGGRDDDLKQTQPKSFKQSHLAALYRLSVCDMIT